MPALRLRPSWLHPPAPQDLGYPVSLLDAAFSLAWVDYANKFAQVQALFARLFAIGGVFFFRPLFRYVQAQKTASVGG